VSTGFGVTDAARLDRRMGFGLLFILTGVGMASKLNRERAARVLVEAEAIGNDQKASKLLKISDRSIRNYRKALTTDPVLAALFREYSEEELRGWRLARVRALRRANERAVELIEAEPDLDKVTRFIEKTGGVDMAGEALGVGSEHHQHRPPPPEDPSGSPEPADEEERPAGPDGG
jgi:hypothetical protein